MKGWMGESTTQQGERMRKARKRGCRKYYFRNHKIQGIGNKIKGHIRDKTEGLCSMNTILCNPTLA